MTAATGDPRSALAAFQHSIRHAGLVIFDFDGVIADSEVVSLKTLRAALEQFGIEHSLDQIRDMFLGTSLRTITAYVDAHGTGPVGRFAKTWETELFARLRAELTPVPFVAELLDTLDAMGQTYCIASSGTLERIGIALDAMDLTHRFSRVFSSEQVARGKPAPDLFRFAASSLGVDPVACVVIEDSVFGVQAAKAAGMACVGFTGGQHMVGRADTHADLLLESGADMVLPSFKRVSEFRHET